MYIMYIYRERERVFVKSRNITAIDIYKLCVIEYSNVGYYFMRNASSRYLFVIYSI